MINPVPTIDIENRQYVYLSPRSENKEPCIPSYQIESIKKYLCNTIATLMYTGSCVTIGVLIYYSAIEPHLHC